MADGIKLAASETRRKAIETKDAQMILGNARCGIADKGDASRLQVGKTAKPVVDRAGVEIGVQRVDREIAPRRIVAPVVGERDRGPAPVGFDVTAQRRDL